MKTETIKAIFTNLLFVIGVILLIVGFSRGVLTATRLLVFGKYPLDYYQETRCDISTSPMIENGQAITKGNYNNDCKSGLEFERRIKLTEDIVNSVTMLVSGIVLTISFRRFIFNKR